MNELRNKNIWISDVGKNPPKIEMLIGSNYYGKLMTGRLKQLENGLPAFETKFAKHVVHVRLGCASTNHETFRNLSVRQPLLDQLVNLSLAFG